MKPGSGPARLNPIHPIGSGRWGFSQGPRLHAVIEGPTGQRHDDRRTFCPVSGDSVGMDIEHSGCFRATDVHYTHPVGKLAGFHLTSSTVESHNYDEVWPALYHKIGDFRLIRPAPPL